MYSNSLFLTCVVAFLYGFNCFLISIVEGESLFGFKFSDELIFGFFLVNYIKTRRLQIFVIYKVLVGYYASISCLELSIAGFVI